MTAETEGCKRRAIFPGTFDPVTLGHIGIIERSLLMCDELVVGVAVGHHKKPVFTVDQRVDLIQEALGDHLRDRVTIKSFGGLLVDFAREESARIIVRGIRVVSDFETEFQMALMNKKLFGEVETVFLIPDQEYIFVTSTLIREVARCGGVTEGLVPKNVTRELKKQFDR